jgi:VCBS repeat-containing protein
MDKLRVIKNLTLADSTLLPHFLDQSSKFDSQYYKVCKNMANVNISNISSRNIIVESSLVLDSSQILPVEKALFLAQDYLQDFASQSDFRDKLATVFSEQANFDAFSTDLFSGDISVLPKIEICSASNINGANGAFAAKTNRIYLSQEFIAKNQENVSEITRVFLEEVGHWIDAKVNTQDTVGDEGELFSNVVRGIDLSESQLINIKQEDDSALVNIDGQEVLIEQAVSLDNLKSSLGQLSNVLGGVKATLQDSIFKTIPIIGDIGKNVSNSNDKVGKLIRTISDLQAVFQDVQSASFGNVNELVASLNQKADEKLKALGLSTDVIEFAKEFEDANGARLKLNFNENISLPSFNIDPTLGLLKSVGFEGFNGTVNPVLDFKLNGLEFGVNSGGSAFVNKDSSKLALDVRLNNAPELKGNLFGGVLGVTLKPEENLGFEFEVGLADPNNYKFKTPTNLFEFNIKTDIKDAPDFIPTIPEIKGVIKLDGAKGFSLSDITVDVSSLKNGFIGKIQNTIGKVVQPIKPIIDLLQTPVPLVDGLYSKYKDSSEPFKTIGSFDTKPNTLSFLDVITFVAKTQDIDFKPAPIIDILNNTFTLSNLDFTSVPLGSIGFDNKGGSVKKVENGASLTGGKSLESNGLKIPLFEDPSNTILDLLLGKNVDLVTYKLPDFQLKGTITQVVPIIGPLGVSIGGSFDIRTQLGFGFDTSGLKSGNLKNGFYLTDTVNGKDVPEINLGAGPTFGPGLQFGAASVDIFAGIGLNLGIDLNNDKDINKDQKFQLNEIDFNSPLSIFDYDIGVNGEIGGSIKVVGGTLFSDTLKTDTFSLAKVDGTRLQSQLKSVVDEFKDFPDKIINLIQKVLKIIKDPVAFGKELAKKGEAFAKDFFDDLGDFARDLEKDVLKGLAELDFTKSDSAISKGLRDLDPTNPDSTVGKIVDDGLKGLAQLDPTNVNSPVGKALDDTFKALDITNKNSVSGKAFAEINDFVSNPFGLNLTDDGDYVFSSTSALDELNKLLDRFNDKNNILKETSVEISVILASDLSTQEKNNQIDPLKTFFETTKAELNQIIAKLKDDNFKELVKQEQLSIGITLEGDAQDNVLLSSTGSDTLKGFDGNDKLSSGAGNDSLIGSRGNDILNAGENGDTLEGGSGNDELYGETGNDFLYGVSKSDIAGFVDPLENNHNEADNDNLFGGSGDDKLYGGRGNDKLYGGDGSSLNADNVDKTDNDELYGGDGDDTLFGAEGSDKLFGQKDKDKLYGDQGNDFLYGGDGDDTLYGGIGADQLFGEANNDALFGGAGDDILNGGTGTDTLEGESGADTIDGGADTDTVRYGSSPKGVVVNIDSKEFNNQALSIDLEPSFNIASGKAQDGFDDIDTLTNIENITGSDFDDVLIGNGSINVLKGLRGNDLLIGNAGDDTLDGYGKVVDPTKPELVDDPKFDPTGTDTVSYRRDPKQVIVNLETKTAFDGFGGTDTLLDIDNVIGSAFGDEITGDAQRNTILAGDGIDTVRGGAGVDKIYGEADKDFLYGGSENDELYGGSGNDELFGETGDDQLFGETGDDQLFGGQGNDIIDGGADNDTVRYDDSTSGAVVNIDENNDYTNAYSANIAPFTFNIARGKAQDGFGTTDTLTNLENITGSNSSDVLIGNEVDNVIKGLAGNDLLIGNGGIDTLEGETGNDSFFGGRGNDIIDGGIDSDTVLYDNSDNGVTVNIDETTDYTNTKVGIDIEPTFTINNGKALDGFGDTDTLKNLENIIGSKSNDILIGNEFQNTILGLTGDDLFIGNKGNDILDGGDGSDTVSYRRDPSRVIVNLATNAATDGFGSTDTLLNIENVVGSKFDDDITGDAKVNIVIAGEDADTVKGGAGDDKLYGEAGNDIISGGTDKDFIDGGTGDDILKGEAGQDTILGGIDNDELMGGTENDDLNGNAGNDKLFSEADNDTLKGEAGNDFIDGGTEIDTVVYDNSPKGVVVNIDESQSYTNAGGIFRNTVVTFKAIPTDLESKFTIDAGTAQDGFDTLDTLRNLENITGSGFRDTLIGNSLDNRILGNAGDDVLVGNAGNDYFDGGVGIDDTVSYRRDPSAVKVNLEQNKATDGFGGSDQIFNVENVIGSSFNDEIIGDALDNTIQSGSGDDIVNARAGNDILFGQDGNDQLFGENGDDFLLGGKGADLLNGGDGSDTASYFDAASAVNISLETGEGFLGEANGDRYISIENLEASEFSDLVIGNAGTNILSGLGGDDRLYGQDGDDKLYGGEGKDRLYGGKGNDNLFGQEGNDVLYGLIGNDFLDGGAGDDQLYGAEGDDTIRGGAGTDTVFYNGNRSRYDITVNQGIYTIVSKRTGEGVDTLYSVEKLQFSDRVFFTVNSVDGPSQNIAVAITGVNDKPVAGTVSTQGTVNVLTGTRQLGGNNADSLTGNDGSDYLDGGNGADSLFGGLGNDTLLGGNGNDLLVGGAGADFLTGGSGADTFRTGGNGADTFRFGFGDSLLANPDRITDLAIGTDVIDGPNAVSAANLRKLGAVSTLDAAGVGALLNSRANFGVNGAATFTFGTSRYLALNDNIAGFNANNDLVIEITGLSGNINTLAII